MELSLHVDLVHLHLEESGEGGILEEGLRHLPALFILELGFECKFVLKLQQILILEVILQVIQLRINVLTLLDLN